MMDMGRIDINSKVNIEIRFMKLERRVEILENKIKKLKGGK